MKYKIAYEHDCRGIINPEGELTREFPDSVHYCIAFKRMNEELPKCKVTGFWNLTIDKRII